MALDLEDDLEYRIKYWEKLQSLKSVLKDNYLSEAIFEECYILENYKEISRVYVSIEKKVSIHNKSSWQEVMSFLNSNMILFEDFFNDYKEFLEN